MKKYFTSNEYKKRNTAHAKKQFKRCLISAAKANAKNRTISGTPEVKKKKRNIKQIRHHDNIKPTAIAPRDLRLIESTQGCLNFFRDLRSDDYLSIKKGIYFVIMSLKNVSNIDYGTISILTAINDEFKYKKIILKTILPEHIDSRNFMIESGYLNNLYDEHGVHFKKSEKSELIFFEKGSGILSEEDNKKISLLVKNVVTHLTGISNYCLSVKTIILEICGNSIEWSGTISQQWLLGVKYESDKVVFTLTDIGKGILETLYRRFTKRFFESFKSNDEILKGAFEKKYGSTTKEGNRNKGLPAVKANHDNGAIYNLKVITNNVILHFDNEQLSKTFEKGSPRFKGTFYQWEMNKDCLTRIIN